MAHDDFEPLRVNPKEGRPTVRVSVRDQEGRALLPDTPSWLWSAWCPEPVEGGGVASSEEASAATH